MFTLAQTLARMGGRLLQESINTGKVLINTCCYLCLRGMLCPILGVKRSNLWIRRHLRFHWVNFPFALHGILLWNSSLRAWCELLDWDSFIALGSTDFPSPWIRPQRGDVWIDCGAHVGRYALRIARLVGPNGRVIAIEPHPETFRVLLHNLALSRVFNTIPIRAAVWSDTTNLNLSVSPQGSFAHSVRDSAVATVLRVPSITLDGLVRGLNLCSVDWIKLDVEGAECEALEGARWILERFEPTLLAEIHGTWKRFESTLRALGYRVDGLESDPQAPDKRWVLARRIKDHDQSKVPIASRSVLALSSTERQSKSEGNVAGWL